MSDSDPACLSLINRFPNTYSTRLSTINGHPHPQFAGDGLIYRLTNPNCSCLCLIHSFSNPDSCWLSLRCCGSDTNRSNLRFINGLPNPYLSSDSHIHWRNDDL